MNEFMYDINSLLIASVLFVSMIGVIEVGYRTGLRFQHTQNDSSKAHVNAILADPERRRGERHRHSLAAH